MTTLLVKNIDYLATFDDTRRELKNGALYVRDNVIEAVGTTAELASMQADTVLDLSGHIVMPGMVNVHHHMYQTLTRVMVQDDELLVWLRERLAHYKCPRSVSFEQQLPRTDTGKLYKQELVEKYSTADQP